MVVTKKTPEQITVLSGILRMSGLKLDYTSNISSSHNDECVPSIKFDHIKIQHIAA